MRKLFVLVVLTILPVSLVQAQSGGDSLVINMKDGSRVAIALADIQKITFDSITAGVSGTITTFEHASNYPNPFSFTTTFELELREAEDVSIDIYDELGRSVRKLVARSASPGLKSITWDGRNVEGNAVPAGAYFAKIQFARENGIERVTAIKVER